MHQPIANQINGSTDPVIPLANAKKVLYMTHLALGDYVYQGAFIKQLCELHPHIQFDIWIDDCREQKKIWHQGRNTTLQQWLSEESHIHCVYPIAASKQEHDALIEQARAEQYDYVVYMATTRIEAYIKVATKIAAQAKIIGTQSTSLLSQLIHRKQYQNLDYKISLAELKTSDHISDFYNLVFHTLFGFTLSREERLRAIPLSSKDTLNAQSLLKSWQEKHGTCDGKTLFINHLSTNSKRDWQLSQVEELIITLHQHYPNTLFVINTPPHYLNDIKKWCRQSKALQHIAIEPFSATNSFFELPSLMTLCQLIISVETAIMHLASSLALPQIAMIRKSASAWKPLGAEQVLLGNKRVDNISVSQVVENTKASFTKLA